MNERAYICPKCRDILSLNIPLSEEGKSPQCWVCRIPMKRYFGGEFFPLINHGFRESQYTNQTDANIAKFQFEHLK